MSRAAFLVPSSEPNGTRTVSLIVPEGEEWEALARGALALLLNPLNYEETGDITADEAAAFFAEALVDTFIGWTS